MIYAIRNNCMLVEMTAKAFHATDPDSDLRPVSAQQAHHWVRSGAPHETPLWIDCDGRIRRASMDFELARSLRGRATDGGY